MKNPIASHHRRGLWVLAALVAVPLLAIGQVANAEDLPGDPIAGRTLAHTWCANCHVFPDSTAATATGAPSFSAVAANKAVTPLALRAFLQTPHDRMPDLHLSNGETDDLIAFVLSLRPR